MFTEAMLPEEVGAATADAATFTALHRPTPITTNRSPLLVILDHTMLLHLHIHP
ncbi:hypothetical protein ACKVWC_003596 [Pyricularia oryzae]